MIHSIKLASDGAVEKHDRVQVPPAPVLPMDGPRVSRSDGDESIVQAALDHNKGALFLAKQRGEFFEFDTKDHSLTKLEVKPLRKGVTVGRDGGAMPGRGLWHLQFEVPASYDVSFRVRGILDLNSLTIKSQATGAQRPSGGGFIRGADYVYITNPNGEGIHVLDAATADDVTVIDTVRKPAYVIRRTRN